MLDGGHWWCGILIAGLETCRLEAGLLGLLRQRWLLVACRLGLLLLKAGELASSRISGRLRLQTSSRIASVLLLEWCLAELLLLLRLLRGAILLLLAVGLLRLALRVTAAEV